MNEHVCVHGRSRDSFDYYVVMMRESKPKTVLSTASLVPPLAFGKRILDLTSQIHFIFTKLFQ